ncbi:MAG: cytochrome c biogenesis protein ResB [Desulfobacteraceae bacterium]|nr:cytochrome c biogenesis protein ResB [Desulfobacteraceae bacterium]
MTEKKEIRAGFLDSLWNFFVSVRLSVVVLLSIAVLSVIGTVIPQNQNPNYYLKAFGPFYYQLMATMDVFDMYHSWWFQLLILILVINIVICSIDRLQKMWSVIFPKSLNFNLKRFRSRSSRRDFNAGLPVDELKGLFEKRLAKKFSYCKTVSTEKGFALTAEKGRWTRLGVYGVHLSVVVLLIGALIGLKFGFEGFVRIAEGQTVDAIRLRNSGTSLKLGFAIRCDDFNIEFYKGGNRPKEFRSSLSILEDKNVIFEKDIIVNDPLSYKGINIYQSSWERLNKEGPAMQGPQKVPEIIEVKFQSAASGIIYAQSSSLGKTIKIPEKLGLFELKSYLPDASFQNVSLGPVIIGEYTNPKGETQTIRVPFRFPNFDKMRKGDVIISVVANLPHPVPVEPLYATGLQVNYDPGVWVVYAGFVMMIAGCAVTFFMSHQRLVVEVRNEGRAVKVMVSGTSNKGKIGFDMRVQRLADQLAGLVSKSKNKD